LESLRRFPGGFGREPSFSGILWKSFFSSFFEGTGKRRRFWRRVLDQVNGSRSRSSATSSKTLLGFPSSSEGKDSLFPFPVSEYELFLCVQHAETASLFETFLAEARVFLPSDFNEKRACFFLL